MNRLTNSQAAVIEVFSRLPGTMLSNEEFRVAAQNMGLYARTGQGFDKRIRELQVMDLVVSRFRNKREKEYFLFDDDLVTKKLTEQEDKKYEQLTMI